MKTVASHIDQVWLSACGGPATSVLVGASLLDVYKRFFIFNPLASYKLANQFHEIPFEALIPNMLTIGDIPDVAAVAAPRPMTIVAPLAADGTELAVSAARKLFLPVFRRYEALGKEQAFHLIGSGEADVSFLLNLSE